MLNLVEQGVEGDPSNDPRGTDPASKLKITVILIFN